MLVAAMDPTTRPQEAPAATQEVIIIIGKCCILLSCTLNASKTGTYTSYYPTYGGGYGYGYPYGWYGFYNPSLLYWSVIPLGFYAGYHMTYSRYNLQNGAYYAPLISSQNSGSQDVMINGTAYTDDTNNYHYTFGVITSTGRPALDSAFYSSSDSQATPADFAYRLTFWQLIEFTDTNNNGILDDGEPISSTIPLQGGWSAIQISNKTSATNSSLTYLEGQTTTAINASNHTFNATLVFRVANVQINNTFALTYEPNSAEYEFSLNGYQIGNSANRVALLQVLSYNPSLPSAADINSTTSANVATQIKTNETYGVSIGPYSEGRLEYNSQLNLTNVTFGSYVSQATQQIQGSLTPIDQWIWSGSSPNGTSVLAITLPAPNNGTQTVAGFAFLDVDVLGLGASSGGNSAFSGGMTKVSSIALTAVSVLVVTMIL